MLRGWWVLEGRVVVDQRSIAVSEEVRGGVDQTTTNTANVMERRRAGLAARRLQLC